MKLRESQRERKTQREKKCEREKEKDRDQSKLKRLRFKKDNKEQNKSQTLDERKEESKLEQNKIQRLAKMIIFFCFNRWNLKIILFLSLSYFRYVRKKLRTPQTNNF